LGPHRTLERHRHLLHPLLLPAKTLGELAHGFLIDAQSPGDLPVRYALGLPLVDGVLAPLRHPRPARGETTRSSQGRQPTVLEPALVTTHGANITAEGPSHLALLSPPQRHQAHHGVGLAASVAHSEVSQGQAADAHHPVAVPLMQAATTVDEDDSIGSRGVIREENRFVSLENRFVSLWRHAGLCIGAAEKSGQFWVRTPEKVGPVFSGS